MRRSTVQAGHILRQSPLRLISSPAPSSLITTAPSSILRTNSFRCLSTATPRYSWSKQPAPPQLPKEEQEIFEKLQKQSTGAFSTPRVNQSPASSDAAGISEPSPTDQASSVADSLGQSQDSSQSSELSKDQQQDTLDQARRIRAQGDGEELHPDVRRGAAPEFEGNVNPRTGESGGPKNEPLRWGGKADWSYNGRVTDF